ncbi:hypothetical protein D9619_003960 [Psilocybe cf. subviscida]|uniref:Uncharacterized protein n=1 Tax=Psilocybe cf. subviscida TaxID=2480587 RepID=A0A8H5F7R6_9AGAR|nr:hypothetical protein D9619_003960 [Psilocybe cf. subviscida]
MKELRARLLNYVAATGRMPAVFGNIPVLDERAIAEEAAEAESSEDDNDDGSEEGRAPKEPGFNLSLFKLTHFTRYNWCAT